MGKSANKPDGGNQSAAGIIVHVRGLVQGVGFRPFVWRLACECGLAGHVFNDGGGVVIRVWGAKTRVNEFLQRLQEDAPPLSRIDDVQITAAGKPPPDSSFHIRHSQSGKIRTGVVPDAATCPDCLADITTPENRRYRYPFTNCTHCGPRLSIIHTIPYDRANTSMADFVMCDDCRGEYDNPADRRFHAQPNACPDCGPQIWLEDKTGRINLDWQQDAIAAACSLIGQGFIIAVKGIGGFHLACDATSKTAVARLRSAKRRYDKPFAIMAKNTQMIGEYAVIDAAGRRSLEEGAAPVTILPGKKHGPQLAPGVAPGQNTLGFMLPYTPLHHIMMGDLECPLVMTSGNISDEPQCISNAAARENLAGIADYWLMHDRDIVNRLDDSVVRIIDENPHILRRARGYAPAPLNLPPGFAGAPPVLAMGAELKNTFCMIRGGQAVLSAHIGDLQDAATLREYRETIELYAKLFAFEAAIICTDMHPDYHSSQWGMRLAGEADLPFEKIQHHHAHIAACMAEYGLPPDSAPVLGIALDGIGLGDDGALWGGEFLLADYRKFERLAHFAPVQLPGGEKAMREPWRNCYAHLKAAPGWGQVCARHPQLPIIRYLKTKPLQPIDNMLERDLNSPAASSAGRLFDAVAAAIGICRDRVSYEGQAAIELEILAEACKLEQAGRYGIDINEAGPFVLSWGAMWSGILGDIADETDTATIAARFHNTLVAAITRIAVLCAGKHRFKTVILTGGVFQNRLLLQAVSDAMLKQEFEVLTPVKFPANDGGISLGQAVIAAAREQKRQRQ